MEQAFFYEFRSVYITWIVFGGLTFVGFGLGLMFWLDFRTRFSRGGHVAGSIVLVGGSLLGVFFGYQATQPEYFKKLAANDEGIHLAYYLFADDVSIRWSEVDTISIQNDRLVIEAGQAANYRSPVVFRGDQAQLLSSVSRLVPDDDS